MKKLAIAAAIAVAAFIVLPVAAAQTVTDAGTGIVLQAPQAAPGAEYASAPVEFVPDGRVDFGEAAGAIIGALGLLLSGWVGGAIRKYFQGKEEAGWADLLIKGTEAAIAYGINATKDATQDGKLSMAIGNEVLERALEYGVRQFPALIEMFGGTEAQRQRIMARLNLEAASRIATPLPRADSFAAPVKANPTASSPAPAPATT